MRFLRRGITLWLCFVLLFFSCCRPVAVWADQNGPVVVLDAGHGGEDGGAVAADGTAESGINLEIIRKLAALMAFLGHEILLTREGEEAVYSPEASTLREKKVSDLQNRAAILNSREDAFLISIHQNSLPSHPKVHGAQVFYNAVSPAQRAGGIVQAALNQAVNGGNERPVTAIDSSIYLMKESHHPAILVECGFLSNREESHLLQEPTYQTRLAAAITAGYRQFLHDNREWSAYEG
ncbi:MAG: N-acetylmuramoyl-L-alanine amidase [Ruminococcaceae bacterium]|jgi:N-acetylmuramoyl-L-alanine amidase|nr:N-acetylmuramoyl-L-alanine amidase [Oscillospiraceae bacterium]